VCVKPGSCVGSTGSPKVLGVGVGDRDVRSKSGKSGEGWGSRPRTTEGTEGGSAEEEPRTRGSASGSPEGTLVFVFFF
jgi:hypothetical protein